MKKATPGAVYSLAVGPGYRDPEVALEQRRKHHAARVAEIEAAVPIEKHAELSGPLRRQLDELRAGLLPADDSVEALVAAEDAAEHYQRRLAEALDVTASVGKHTRGWLGLSSGRALVKWALIAVVAAVLLVVIINELLMALAE